MYRISATSDVHSVLHFARKAKCTYFAEEIYILISDPKG